MNPKFHSELANYIVQHDTKGAHDVILRELGNSLAHNRVDFVDMLNNAGVSAKVSMSDAELVNLFVSNVGNKKVLIGAAFLVNAHNKVSGADGAEIRDTEVKAAYRLMNEYWGDYSLSGEEDTSNLGGGLISGILQGGMGITNKVLDAKNKKKFGALDAVTAQQQAKAEIAKSVIAHRQAQIDSLAKAKADKAKNIKIAIIAGASLLAIGIGVGIYMYMKKRKSKK